MANEFKVKNGLKFPDGTVQTTASAGGSGGSYLPLAGGTMAGAITFDASQTRPTFNQNTTGTAANVTGTVAIANGGTGATTAAAALTNLGAQPTLVSGTNIKTVNGTSILGSGDLTISGGSSSITIQNKNAAYTVVAGDNGKIINCSGGAFTISLTAAATLGAGFNCWVWNTSTTATDVITIDPDASETIEGKTTHTLRVGEGVQIVCTGSAWLLGGKRAMRGYAENIPSGNAPVASGNYSVALGGLARAIGYSSFAAMTGSNSVYGNFNPFFTLNSFAILFPYPQES